jgi:hypothetical protein
VRGPFHHLVDELTPRPPVKLAWWGWVLAAVLSIAVVAALAWIPHAAAQGVGFTDRECKALAHFARASAEIRDIGAQLEKHVVLVRQRVAEGGWRLSLELERELRRVYAERLEPSRAEESAHTRCMSGEILRRAG